jgi:hypothetical protein
LAVERQFLSHEITKFYSASASEHHYSPLSSIGVRRSGLTEQTKDSSVGTRTKEFLHAFTPVGLGFSTSYYAINGLALVHYLFTAFWLTLSRTYGLEGHV